MRASTIVGLAVFAFGSVSAVAFAEETAPAAKKQRVIVVDMGPIKGHRPVAPSVDIARKVMKAPLPELRKPLVDPAGTSIDAAPF